MSSLMKRNKLVLPAYGYSMIPKRGMELINLRQLGMMAIAAGGAVGINTEGDIPNQTTDGVSYAQVWADYQATVTLQNSQRDPLVQFLTFPTTRSWDQVLSSGNGTDFEEATEFGEPVGIRVTGQPAIRGYDHKWYDLAARYTWRFLLKADVSQLDAIHTAALEADNRLMFDKVMRTLFNATNKINQEGQTVFKFYNNDGEVPPAYKTNTFASTHTHYVGTGAATTNLDSQDIEAGYADLAAHGYGVDTGNRVILLAHSAQTAVIRQWRAGVAINTNGVGAVTPVYDFIPAANQAGRLILPLTQQLVNGQASGTEVPGFNVIGSYGNVLIVEEDMIPAGYSVMFSTGGPNVTGNPIALRSDPRLTGLQLVKGRTPDYPLIDSFYTRGIGTGVKNRGQAFIMQVGVAAAAYTPPAAYAVA